MRRSNAVVNLEISKTDKTCPVGERVAGKNLEEGKIPVLSCEGGCIRGEIARLAANRVAKENPYRRGCHAELFTAPHSAMARWIINSEKIVLIDGCFMECHGRILENMIAKKKLVRFDALSIYQKYTDIFDIDDIPEEERKETSRTVDSRVLIELSKGSGHEATFAVSTACEVKSQK
jgi:uncharacterized metal-binding protein